MQNKKTKLAYQQLNMSKTAPQINIEQATSLDKDTVLQRLSVDVQQGLDETAVKQRQQKYGKNRLQEFKQRSAGQILIAQFKSPIIALLAVAAVLSFAFQEWIEGIAVIIAILFGAYLYTKQKK